MKRSRLPIVFALLLLTGCDGKLDNINDCIAGKEKPVPLQKAIEVVKAAGLEVREPEPAKANEPSPPRQFMLLCVTTVQGQRLTQSLSVDLDARTVNGASADITPDQIKWSTPERNPYNGTQTKDVHSLNRLNGDYRSYTEGAIYAAPPPTYGCTTAPKPAF
ncbi:hypothetical protein [Paraburkholderia diazotrophica]|nr:hypothetical protein [Paraburkholderia diazotrophica]